jgi:hypothetical protein
MSSEQSDLRPATRSLLDRDEVQCVLSGAFYTPETGDAVSIPTREITKPTHYKVICISLYNEDLDHLDSMVEQLKAKGLTKANRSALIRYALSNVDLESVPRGL